MTDTRNITVNDQSSIRFAGKKVIYADPFNIFGQTHDADLIFITHPHYDHFSSEDISRVSNAGTRFVVPGDMKSELDRIGVSEDHIYTIAAGEKMSIDGVGVEAVPAYNTNKAFHEKSKGWLGYVLTLGNTRYYIAGDTDGLEENTKIECDVAFIPIGGTYTMDAAEAASFVNRLHPACVIPIHYGSIVGKKADFEVFRAAVDDDIEVVRKL